MTDAPRHTSRLALVAAGSSLVLGGTALWLGLLGNAPATWGFGIASLLQAPASLAVWYRVREGLGNRGLDGERRTLRITSHLLRFLALGLAIACALSWTGGVPASLTAVGFGLAPLATACFGSLWFAKRRVSGLHPSLKLDAARIRAMVELALLLLVGDLLGRVVPWGGCAVGLVMALRLFIEGRTLAKGTTVSLVGCGGCGSCGCG